MSPEENFKEYPPPIRRPDSSVLRPGSPDSEYNEAAFRAFQSLLTYSGRASKAEASPGGFSLRDVFYVFFRHKKKIVGIFLLCSMATFYYLAAAVSLYKSEGRVFIRGDRSSISVDPTAEENSFLRSGGGADVQVRSEMALIASAAVAEKAVEKLGLDHLIQSSEKVRQEKGASMSRAQAAIHRALEYARMPLKAAYGLLNLVQPPLTEKEKWVQGIIAGLEVAPSSGGSAVLNVTYTATDPKMAQDILNAVLEGYVQTHISVHKSPVSPEFFKGRAEDIQKKLRTAEEQLDRRRKELNIASITTEKELLLNRLNLLESRINETAAEMSSSQARIAALRRTLSGANSGSNQPAEILDATIDPETARLNEQLVQLRMKEMDLRTKYKDGYKDLEDTRSQIRQLEAMISTRKTTRNPAVRSADPLRQGLTLQHETDKALLDGLAAREMRLNAEANAARERLRELVSHEKELDSLQREVDTAESEYQQYMKTLQASEISDLLDQGKVGNVSILQRATHPTSTVRTQKKTLALLAFGIFAGLAGGIGLAFVLEFLNHTIKTSEDVERNLGLPVLVSLPMGKHARPLLKEDAA